MAAILIPTLGRPDFLIRQLRYYQRSGNPHAVYIGDSSSGEDASRSKAVCQELSGTFKIVYLNRPKATASEVCVELLEQMTEEFICFCGDDDFQVPSGVSAAEQFLKDNPGYSSARGRSIIVTLHGTGLQGAICQALENPQPEILADTSEARVKDYLSRYYTSIFSVCRKEIFHQGWKLGEGLGMRGVSDEFLVGTYVISQGKSKTFEGLGFVRQDHQNRFLLPRNPDFRSQGPAGERAFQRFAEVISASIAGIDGVSVEQARRSVLEAWELYLARSYPDREVSMRSLQVALKQALKKCVPGMPAWVRWRDRRLADKGRGKFALLDPGLAHASALKTVLSAMGARSSSGTEGSL